MEIIDVGAEDRVIVLAGSGMRSEEVGRMAAGLLARSQLVVTAADDVDAVVVIRGGRPVAVSPKPTYQSIVPGFDPVSGEAYKTPVTLRGADDDSRDTVPIDPSAFGKVQPS